MFGVTAWRRRRALRNPGFTPEQWREVIEHTALLRDWPEAELARLNELVSFFLRAKTFSAPEGEVVSPGLRLQIAAQACVPILHLGLDYYAEWVEVIVYPDAFVTRYEEVDEAGVLHSWRRSLSGEAWSHGPVVLSRADVEDSARHWSEAYERCCERVDAGEETVLDPYAADSPAEFFAVMSEAFFELPNMVHSEFPRVYGQLAAFYRTDPAASNIGKGG